MQTTTQTQQPVDNGLSVYAPLANITAVGCLILMVLWMVTRGFPKLLERSDKAHADGRREFLAALDKQTESRSMSAAAGHEVASRMQGDLHDMAAEFRRSNDMRVQDTRKTANFGGT